MTSRERVAKHREKNPPLTQNQKDALQYLKDGGFLARATKQVWFEGKPFTYRLQKNTITSLHKRGLITVDHSDEKADYYTLTEKGKSTFR